MHLLELERLGWELSPCAPESGWNSRIIHHEASWWWALNRNYKKGHNIPWYFSCHLSKIEAFLHEGLKRTLVMPPESRGKIGKNGSPMRRFFAMKNRKSPYPTRGENTWKSNIWSPAKLIINMRIQWLKSGWTFHAHPGYNSNYSAWHV